MDGSKKWAIEWCKWNEIDVKDRRKNKNCLEESLSVFVCGWLKSEEETRKKSKACEHFDTNFVYLIILLGEQRHPTNLYVHECYLLWLITSVNIIYLTACLLKSLKCTYKSNWKRNDQENWKKFSVASKSIHLAIVVGLVG